MKISDISSFLEQWAPPAYQEGYDNSGLIVGSPNTECTGVVVSLDVTEDVIEEAASKGANLIVSHHPIVFSGLKRLNGSNYVERCVMLAIKKDIALYAIHTNLDNISTGVNAKLAEVLELTETHILSSKDGWLRKLITYVPKDKTESVREGLFDAGAGHVGDYKECSFTSEGIGTFKAREGTNPYTGDIGIRHEENEVRLEVIFPFNLQGKVIKALMMTHPYEEVAYDILKIENAWPEVGSGMVGQLAEEMELNAFLAHLKSKVGGVVRHTEAVQPKVKKIAICGGSGSFLLKDAIRAGADVFVTGDFKYHQFFDADGKIVIADIGHFESEQFTIDLLFDAIHEKFPTFATFKTEVKTNPIIYL